MDIISLPVEFDRKKIDGRYRLVAIAAQKARELAQGNKPTIATKARKVTTIALQEAIYGPLDYLVGEEAKKAKEEARKLEFKRLAEEAAKRAATPGELSELEKDLKVYLHEKEERQKKGLEDIFVEEAPTEGD